MNTPFVREDIIWAAGLFEGEGCFYARKRRYTILATLGMTDEDVVRRFQKSVGGLGRIKFVERASKNWKDVWKWEVESFEAVQALVVAFWPWLGERRRRKAMEMLSRHRLGEKEKTTGICKDPGCNRERFARGLCIGHYTKLRDSGSMKPLRTAAEALEGADNGTAYNYRPKECEALGCDRGQHGFGLCKKHYCQLRRNGLVEGKLGSIRRSVTPCKVRGCVRGQHHCGLCSAHYSQLRRHGKMDGEVEHHV